MIRVEAIMNELRKSRPIFHWEADFQHALAWEIHIHFPAAIVRIEVHPGRIGPREYLDIWIRDENITYAIELKYKTRKLDAIHNGEEFRLLNHGAQDIGRYDFIKDVARVERFVIGHPRTVGYAIMLTNDNWYWQTAEYLSTADANFRIHDTRTINGELRWSEATGVGTMRGRENPLVLNCSHEIRWFNYSELVERGPNKSRYVLLKMESA